MDSLILAKNIIWMSVSNVLDVFFLLFSTTIFRWRFLRDAQAHVFLAGLFTRVQSKAQFERCENSIVDVDLDMFFVNNLIQHFSEKYLFFCTYIYIYIFASWHVLRHLTRHPIQIPTPGKLVLDMFKFGALGLPGEVVFFSPETFQGLHCFAGALFVRTAGDCRKAVFMLRWSKNMWWMMIMMEMIGRWMMMMMMMTTMFTFLLSPLTFDSSSRPVLHNKCVC